MHKPNNSFIHTIVSTYGEKGIFWLKNIPNIIENCIQLWNLKNLIVYENLTYNYVLFGTMYDTSIVLKLRYDKDELEKEIAALQFFKNYGCVNIIAYNISFNALLLEQIIPGKPLTSFFPNKDKIATNIAINTITTLHQTLIPSDSLFPTLEQMLPTFSKKDNLLAPFMNRAQTLRNYLLNTQQKIVLLHGDFHSGNILSSHNAKWIVIDPEGIIGDPLYDIAIYIRNPLKELIKNKSFDTIIANRIKMFSFHLKYDQKRILDWVYLQAVSSAYWSIEDNLDVTNHIKFLKGLETIKI